MLSDIKGNKLVIVPKLGLLNREGIGFDVEYIQVIIWLSRQALIQAAIAVWLSLSVAVIYSFTTS